ncbi:MAG: hypothetical protein ABEK59_13015 [Halobacteria archaeon]
MSNNKPKKAIVATIDLGFDQLEGLMLPDGSYGIAVQQLARVFQTHNNYASQEFKRLIGEDFQPHKVATELTSNNRNQNRKNVVDLKTAKKIIKEQKQKNKKKKGFS